jgi:hypothetical protein
MRCALGVTAVLLAAALPATVALLMVRADPAPTASGGATRTVEAGGVQVTATLECLEEAGATIHLALDTHTGALDVDLAVATLTVDGAAWPLAGWDGDPPGGHHRAGTLRFDAAGPPAGAVRLDLDGLPASVSVTWSSEDLP